MNTSSMFAKPSDFLNRFGIDLNAELRDTGTEVDSGKADRFLARAEDVLFTECRANLGFPTFVKWEDVLGNRETKDLVQKAVLEQAFYMFRNGDLTSDSGYDPQRGSIASKDDIRRREVSDYALDIMKSTGLFTHSFANLRRYGRWF